MCMMQEEPTQPGQGLDTSRRPDNLLAEEFFVAQSVAIGRSDSAKIRRVNLKYRDCLPQVG